jgi:acyl-coenzyme A synthetase/AMP-(fatty) acid ligase
MDAIVEAGIVSIANRFGITEIWAMIVAGPSVTDAQILDHCRRRLLPAFVPNRLVRAQRLPKNQMGKIDRARLLNLIQAQGR